MAKTNLYLDMRGRAADGMGSLQLTLYNNRTTASLPLGVRLKPNQWKNSTVVNRPDSAQLNVAINKRKSEIDMRLLLLSSTRDIRYTTASELKKLLTGEKPVVKNTKHLLSSVFFEYMSQDISNGSREIYKTALNKILSYTGNRFVIEDIDYKWIVSFTKYMSKTQSINGRALYLRHLRAVCNYAVHTGIIDKYPFENYSIKTEPTSKRNISVETLREFYKFPVDATKQRYRDYFFLMFYLIGINAVDLLHATHDMVHNGRLEYRRTKTHSDLLSVKIEPEASILLEKYRGEQYLLEAMDKCCHYKYFLHRMNDSLGQIGPEIQEEIPSDNLFELPKIVTKVNPIVPDITSYYARHTWATFAHKLGISSDVIGLALGHSTKTRVTWVYIEPDRSQVDSANRRVIDYFMGI